MADSINDIISRTPSGGTAMLPSGEFEGPVYITKPLRLVGQNTTIWAKRGSVIEITAAGAAIEDLRVELTEAAEHDTAIVANKPAQVKNVEVLGGVKGFGAEDGYFDVPKTIALGSFAADAENTFSLSVNVPAPTSITCDTAGVSFNPSSIPAGRSEITVCVKGISAQTFLYAQALFSSSFVRRIYVTGRPSADTPAVTGKCIFTAPERVLAGNPQQAEAPKPASQPQTETLQPLTDVIAVQNPAPLYDLPLLELKKGQRTAVGQYIGTSCQITFSCHKPAGLDIDPYVFLLDENQHSFGDRGLVFFGNESSRNEEVLYFPKDGHVEIDLDKADYRVQRIALAYSVYAGGPGKSFGQVISPKVTISARGKERIAFSMDGLAQETTVVALEFYRYKGEWKLSAVGAGFRDGMAKLCNRYGIEVEE